VEALHDQNKDYGAKGFNLSKAATMANPFTRNAIEEDFGAISRKEGGDQVCPSARIVDRSKKVEKKDPSH
jgi:hypothetical protein